jgi:transcriptional regulator with XRE-family HTH domain
MSTYQSGIGNRIKNARKAAKMSQTELGTHLGKTLRTIQKYESDEITPSITTIYALSKVLHVPAAELIGYQANDMHLNTLSDVISFLHELNRKKELRFEIVVNRPPRADEWSCSIQFNGKDPAEYNADLCLFLERFEDERNKAETYWTDQEHYEHWFDTELAYYTPAKLTDKTPEMLSVEERLKRRDEVLRQELTTQNE